MFIQTVFNFSSVGQRLACRFSVLRLLALRWFVAFLASCPCTASASSYLFVSTVQPRWRSAFPQFVPVVKSWLPVLASGSDLPPAAAYLGSLCIRTRNVYLINHKYHHTAAKGNIYYRSKSESGNKKRGGTVLTNKSNSEINNKKHLR